MSGERGSEETTFRSLDGLMLAGTLTVPVQVSSRAVVLVHGGGVTREEGGFFTRLAFGLAAAGCASLRFDFRAHGASEGRMEDLTLSGVLNDIRAAVDRVRLAVGEGAAVGVVGASFGGGIAAYFAAKHPGLVHRLVLVNPLLNYKKRFIDDKPYWHDDHIDEEAAGRLAAEGYIAHSPTFKLGRALLNEVFYLRPHRALGEITAPTLFLHGTGDTFVPVESSRWGVRQITGARAQLVEIEGAQHGIAVHDDPRYLDPQTQVWQAAAIDTIVGWMVQ